MTLDSVVTEEHYPATSGSGGAMYWQESWRADPRGSALADRHYSRQSPGHPQFVPPAACVVLITSDAGAVWATTWPKAEFTKHAWAGAWVNSLFRRQSGPLASELIREACSVTRYEWGTPPPLGMITFVDVSKVIHKRDPGRCYLKAGFKVAGHTQGGLLALQLSPEDFPEPIAPLGRYGQLSMAVE